MLYDRESATMFAPQGLFYFLQAVCGSSSIGTQESASDFSLSVFVIQRPQPDSNEHFGERGLLTPTATQAEKRPESANKRTNITLFNDLVGARACKGQVPEYLLLASARLTGLDGALHRRPVHRLYKMRGLLQTGQTQVCFVMRDATKKLGYRE